MSESSNSQSHKKAEQEEQPAEQGQAQPEPQSGAGGPVEQEANLYGEFEPENEGEEYTEEYPEWLLSLESKSADLTDVTVSPGSKGKTKQNGENAGTDSDNLPEEDLPDWLLENYTPAPQTDKEKPPDYEIPEWLQVGLDELSATEGGAEDLPTATAQPPEVSHPDDTEASQISELIAEQGEPSPPSPREPGDLETLLSLMDDPTQLDEAALGDEQIYLSEGEEADEYLFEGITPAPPAPQSIETLTEVRHSLKNAEQSEPKKERRGFIERLTGWIWASSHIQQQRIEQRLEGQMDQSEAQAAGLASSEQMAQVTPESPAEAQTSWQEEASELLPEAIAGALLFDAATGFDESSETEIGTDESGDESIDAADHAVGPLEEEPSSDQESLDELMPESEASESDQGSRPPDDEKEKKGFLGGLFGLKKADQPEDTTISDEEIERRLLIALGAASLEESPAPAETAQESEEPLIPVQEEETDFLFWEDTEYEDVESSLFKDEEQYQAEAEEVEEQLAEEAPPATGEPGLAEEEPAEAATGDSFMALREVALQDYVESPPPPAPGPVSKFLKSTSEQISDFSLAQKLALAALIIINLGLVAILGIIFLFSMLPVEVTPAPVEPTPLPALQGPFPVQVTLPGGWSFDLTQGTLKDGYWLNEGAEWLRGTEITRWVALPWSEQLEAVVVTLGPEDRIELTLSNQDRLKYKVDAVIEVPVAKVADLNLDRPSLLLILANRGTDTRVVVTASLAEDE